MRETKTLEFKEAVSNSFLKTVSAFANYRGGSILFGVDDGGRPLGVADPVQTCLVIENKINDSISPSPDYNLLINDADSTIELKVAPGRAKPYYYRSKAYKRNDASTIEVDETELTRLLLEGKNTAFEELPSERQGLGFNALGKAMKEELGLEEFNRDTLRTLNLLSREGEYNNAAALLADDNDFPGVDIAQFGESIDTILRRVTCEGSSVLESLEASLRVYEDLYCHEEVAGFKRRRVERIPREAFREAIANALVHRTWDVPAHIRVAMFDDRVEVVSPGGLPVGISEKEYLSDMISVRRNPILANVFYRLGIIEAFGTGILRIRAAYESSAIKPQFTITDNAISVCLPVIREELGLSRDQQQVFELLSSVRPISAGELAEKVDFSRSKLTYVLKQLIDLNVVSTTGSGRGLKYKRV